MRASMGISFAVVVLTLSSSGFANGQSDSPSRREACRPLPVDLPGEKLELIAGGAEAEELFAGKLRAISPERYGRAVEVAEARGWKPGERFHVFGPADSQTPGVRPVQFRFDAYGVTMWVWDWDTGNPETAGGYFIVQSPTSRWDFWAEIWVDYDWVAWTHPVYYYSYESGSGLYGISTQPRTDGPGASVLRVQQPSSQCAQLISQWGQCLAGCLRDKTRNTFWGAVGGAVGGATVLCPKTAILAVFPVAGAGLSAGSYVGCVAASSGAGLAAALVHQFWWSDACDSQYKCGAKPNCQ
jgi:hypothetical protein